MFPQKRRIGKEKFPLIAQKGLFFKSPGLSLRVASQENRESPALFAVVVSNKVAKLATERNFLKRRTRAFLQPWLKSVKSGLYLVFYITDKNLGQMEAVAFKKQIESLLIKAKIINV